MVQTASRAAVPLRRARVERAEERLTGAPAVRRLYEQVAADPAEHLHLDVVGPGGSGKTVLVDALAALHARVGTPVVRQPDVEPVPDGVLIVDDAHQRDDAELERTRRWVRTPGARVVLARRPWPCPPALSALVLDIGATRPPLVLGALDRAGVAERAALLLGRSPSVDLVELVTEQTGGSPLLVDRLLAGLRERGELDGVGSVAGEPPTGVLHLLGHQVRMLPATVRDLVLARAVGAPPDPDLLAELLGLSTEVVVEHGEQAQAAGVLLGDGELIPLVRQAVLWAVPATRRLGLRRRLAELQLDRGTSVSTVARGLLGSGATGTRVATALRDAGDESLAEFRPNAAEYFAAAVEAGAPRISVAARRAEAAMLSGDLDGALHHADHVLTRASDTRRSDARVSETSASDGADSTRAALVAAAALAHRGLLARSAATYRWLGAAAGPAAVPTLLGTGDLTGATAALTTPGSAHPPVTLLGGAEQLIARGLLDSVTGAPTSALAQLTQAATMLVVSGRAALLPDTPAALAAITAVHCGEIDVAQSVLDAAVVAGSGGRACATRHRLLQAWLALHRGAIAAARGLLTTPVGGDRLGPRDEFLAAALDVALARRTGDVAALLLSWGRVRTAIARHPVDLYSLHILGELLVAASRLRQQDWVTPHLTGARDLLAGLGDPPLWSAPLRWAGLHAAIVDDDAATAQLCQNDLEGIASSGRYAAAMAVAGRCWLRLTVGDVDATAVEDAARGLAAAGLVWEGGRLAGQSALRTRDRKDMTALLGVARAIQGGGIGSPPSAAAQTANQVPADEALDDPVPVDPVGGALSDREREVAELVLAGLTYRQIGEQLFISAKTVEHHVSRMRRRLRSGSRGELFTHLRMLVDSSPE